MGSEVATAAPADDNNNAAAVSILTMANELRRKDARLTALETRLKAERAEVDAWREHDVCGNVKCRVKNCQLSVLMDQTDAARKECPL